MDKKQSLEREALLKRLQEVHRKLAENERRITEIEATLPLEEQLRLKLQRLLTAKFPSLRRKVSCSG